MVKYTNKHPKLKVNKRPFIGTNTRFKLKQKAEVMAIAAKCGMTESEYIRARSLGYNPRARLSCYEALLLENFSVCRADLLNFTNALKSLREDEKIALFHTRSKMLTWLKSVNIVAQACKEYIDDITKSDRIPMEYDDVDDDK